jgi:hypothetical protein
MLALHAGTSIHKIYPLSFDSVFSAPPTTRSQPSLTFRLPRHLPRMGQGPRSTARLSQALAGDSSLSERPCFAQAGLHTRQGKRIPPHPLRSGLRVSPPRGWRPPVSERQMKKRLPEGSEDKTMTLAHDGIVIATKEKPCVCCISIPSPTPPSPPDGPGPVPLVSGSASAVLHLAIPNPRSLPRAASYKGKEGLRFVLCYAGKGEGGRDETAVGCRLTVNRGMSSGYSAPIPCIQPHLSPPPTYRGYGVQMWYGLLARPIYPGRSSAARLEVPLVLRCLPGYL